MPKSSNQKLKLLLLEHYLTENTDEEHGVTVAQMLDMLESNGIAADRKTIYSDLETLRQFGMEILDEREGRDTFYKFTDRIFDLAELKLLVDSVLSAKFITVSKSDKLIGELTKLASRHQARELRRDAVISGRIKSMNESVLINVDRLHRAILDGLPVSFVYWQWNMKKEQEPRRNGARYTVLPHALMWDDENYYLVATDAASGIRKHYRVDKMKELRTLSANQWPENVPHKVNDLPKYTKSLFGMFGGETTDVTLLCENGLIGPIIDRFGKETAISPADGTHFRAHVTVEASDQFFGWIIGLGGGAVIESPASLTERMRGIAARLTRQYAEELPGNGPAPADK